MSETAIRVDGLGKLYRLGSRERYGSLRETLADMVSAPFRRRASRSGQKGEGTLWALRDVSFEIKRGEAVGIIGLNGAGKSTLLKILCRITEPTEGWARLRGRVGSLLEVGTGFHPELTGRENIFLNGAILGMHHAEIERKFDEIIAFAEVERFLDTPVKRYSSGMYLRLAFAVAAHLEPEILLVDEVLAVGDVSFQKKCLGKMGEVRDRGRTVLFVSHNMAAIRNLCVNCVWLQDGAVHKLGSTDVVVDEYIAVSLGLSENATRDLSRPETRVGVRKSILSNISFTAISLLNRDGHLTAIFKEGDPIRIRLLFRSEVEAEDAEIFVLVLSAEGIDVFSCYSGGLGKIKRDAYQIEVGIPSNPLRSGTYRIRLYLRSGHWQDVIPEAANFRIEPSSEDAIRAALGHSGLLGLVRTQSTWSAPEPVTELTS